MCLQKAFTYVDSWPGLWRYWPSFAVFLVWLYRQNGLRCVDIQRQGLNWSFQYINWSLWLGYHRLVSIVFFGLRISQLWGLWVQASFASFYWLAVIFYVIPYQDHFRQLLCRRSMHPLLSTLLRPRSSWRFIPSISPFAIGSKAPLWFLDALPSVTLWRQPHFVN